MSPYYQDDFVTLYHGDCLELADFWTGADVLVTDPPYGVQLTLNARYETCRVCGKPSRSRYGTCQKCRRPDDFQHERTSIHGDEDTASRDAVLELWGGRPAVVFGSWKRARPEGTRAVLTWDKGMASGMGDLSIPWKPNTEEVYILGSGFVGHRGSSVLAGHTVVSWASRGREHPNMKPQTLMEALIAKCPPGVVADPFAGSGSTLVAAKALGRRAVGVELDERYCEIAAKRLAQGVLDFGGAA